MQDAIWSQLRCPFSQDALEWRIVEVSADTQQARVRPLLLAELVKQRLDEVLGPEGWSQKFLPLDGQAIICELSILHVSKSAIVSFEQSWQDAITAAYDAFVYAAEALGIKPPLDTQKVYWVDYDSENHSILFEPEVESLAHPVASPIPFIKAEKSEGQQALDRLVDRLRQEGLGLEAAKLLVTYGGYGQNSEAARELYSRLRTLLVQGAKA